MRCLGWSADTISYFKKAKAFDSSSNEALGHSGVMTTEQFISDRIINSLLRTPLIRNSVRKRVTVSRPPVWVCRRRRNQSTKEAKEHWA